MKTKPKIIGYQVHEECPDDPIEQVLVLRTGADKKFCRIVPVRPA